MTQKIFDPNKLPFKVRFSNHYVPRAKAEEMHQYFSYNTFLRALREEKNPIIQFILKNWIPLTVEIEAFDRGEINRFQDGSIGIYIGLELPRNDNEDFYYYGTGFTIENDIVTVSSYHLMWPFKMGEFYNEEIE